MYLEATIIDVETGAEVELEVFLDGDKMSVDSCIMIHEGVRARGYGTFSVDLIDSAGVTIMTPEFHTGFKSRLFQQIYVRTLEYLRVDEKMRQDVFLQAIQHRLDEIHTLTEMMRSTTSVSVKNDA